MHLVHKVEMRKWEHVFMRANLKCYYLLNSSHELKFYFTHLLFPNHIYTGFVGDCVGFADRECMVWYMLFIIFVPYAMLPLPLKYCMIGGTISGTAHLIVISIGKLQKSNVNLVISSFILCSFFFLSYTINLLIQYYNRIQHVLCGNCLQIHSFIWP